MRKILSTAVLGILIASCSSSDNVKAKAPEKDQGEVKETNVSKESAQTEQQKETAETAMFPTEVKSSQPVTEVKASGEPGKLYLISTNLGDIKIKIYDKTPLHQANFDSLVQAGFYNGLLFHRVIDQFMIQGGDPTSKGAKKGTQLGSGGPGYTLPAEIKSGLYHKRGAIAAARQADQVNPQRRSSGSQFYIVEGRVIPPTAFPNLEQNINRSAMQQLQFEIFRDPKNAALVKKYQEFYAKKQQDSLAVYGQIFQKQLDAKMAGKRFKFTEEQKKIYQSVGGTPMLDGQYTVFGEVIEGMKVVDAITQAKKGAGDRPEEDVKMTIKKL